MYSIGVDIGSVGTKGVLFNGDIVDQVIMPTGWNPKEAGAEALDNLLKNNNLVRKDIKQVVATGYGRVSADFADKVVTEITCHAKGGHFLDERVRTIIDIGGQDSKAISIDKQGNVVDFMMNDKCAAGTGKFLEITVNSLGENINELDQLTENTEPQNISSMCTVFAESEVISLLSQGVAKESIALGIVHAIANQAQILLNKIPINSEILFTGGLAKSERIKEVLSDKLEKEIIVSSNSQIAGALGAAVIGNSTV
ncbi:acyl-CoA dehydratase activase [Acetohalobium arabaticum]|uniref:CoA-substrate-specific enzyme activase n=1 Tax=Acetohalobium arabaticum (strain ATCC 49924 / DSM 5501 / Z-7288) TaxID=574087 RepID=D9QUG7_ACEAZ|nr:acyl-CoA dehydratase activase [Acetohalobium arabaticum]ADL13768.1 CoA-substrate-specific enzyme activase [Acetohalobium arabaticum DSM 5501]